MKFKPKRYRLKKPQSNKPRKCVGCKELLTKENWYKNNGHLYSRCMTCKKEYFQKQNLKRKKALKDFKLW